MYLFRIVGAASLGKGIYPVLRALLIFLTFAHPACEALSLSAEQNMWLRTHADIVVGTTTQQMRDSGTQPQNGWKNISLEYLNLLASEIGFRYRIRSYANEHDLQHAVCNGDVDLITAQIRSGSPKQEGCVAYTLPYFQAMPVVVARRGSGIMDSSDVHGLRLAVKSGSDLAESLATRFPGTDLFPYDNVPQALTHVLDQQVDAFVGAPQDVHELLQTPPFRQLHVVGSINTATRSLAFGVDSERHILLELLDAAILASHSDKPYIASAATASKTTVGKLYIPLTVEERAALENIPTLRVGYPVHEYPYAFFDNFGQPSGLAADFFDIIAEGLGLRFEFIPTESPDDALEELRRGHIQVLAVSQDSPEDTSTLNTQAYAEAPMVIAVRSTDAPSDLRDLAGMNVAIDAGALPSMRSELRKHRIYPITVRDAAEGLHKVRSSEVRAYIGDLFILDPLIQRKHIGIVKIAAPVGVRRGIAIGLAAKYAGLAPLFNKVLTNLPSGREQRIVSTWLAPQYSYGIPQKVFWNEIIPAMAVLLLSGTTLGIGYWRLRKEVHRRTESELKLEMARDLAQSQAQARSMFLAVMSHEIRTPLSGVLGMLELLMRTPMRSEQREMVSAIDEAARALLQILDTVLDYSKVDAGRIELEHTPVDLRAVLSNVIVLMCEPAKRRGVIVTCEIDPTVPQRVNGDPIRIRQVLANLIGNAAKFTHKGEIKISVTAHQVDISKLSLQVLVEDSGDGISAAALKTLMEPFKQADKSTARKYGGTGLGLAVSLRLAKLMDGDITLESQLGRGTTARFAFVVDVTTQADEENPELWQSVEFFGSESTIRLPQEADSVAIDCPRVLVVEDHRINREMLIRQLHALGCTSIAVADAASALEALMSEEYDLLITDWQLATSDGETLARNWRNWERSNASTRRLPIMMLSAALQPNKGAWAEAGIDAFIRKPVRLEALRRAMLQMLPSWVAPLPNEDTRHGVDRGADLIALSALCGSPCAAREMLAHASVLLRQDIMSLGQALSTFIEKHWAPEFHRLLGAISTIGHWHILDEGEALERAIANKETLLYTPQILPLLQGLERIVDELDSVALEDSKEAPPPRSCEARSYGES